ncbi:MAG: hypothetical protein ACLGI9_03610, partial [Thermoanaerobaculia bacterium]
MICGTELLRGGPLERGRGSEAPIRSEIWDECRAESSPRCELLVSEGWIGKSAASSGFFAAAKPEFAALPALEVRGLGLALVVQEDGLELLFEGLER